MTTDALQLPQVVAVKLYIQSDVQTLPEFTQKTQLMSAHPFGSEPDVERGEDPRLNENNDIKRHWIFIKRRHLAAAGAPTTNLISLQFAGLNVERKCDLGDRDGVPSVSLFGGSKKTNCVRADLTEGDWTTVGQIQVF